MQVLLASRVKPSSQMMQEGTLKEKLHVMQGYWQLTQNVPLLGMKSGYMQERQREGSEVEQVLQLEAGSHLLQTPSPA